MGIIGITVRRVTPTTLLQWWLWGNILIYSFLHYYLLILATNYTCWLLSYWSCREPPKKRKRTTKTAESSIVPCEDGAPARMCFPPRHNQCLENTSNKEGKGGNSESGGSKRYSFLFMFFIAAAIYMLPYKYLCLCVLNCCFQRENKCWCEGNNQEQEEEEVRWKDSGGATWQPCDGYKKQKI